MGAKSTTTSNHPSTPLTCKNNVNENICLSSRSNVHVSFKLSYIILYERKFKILKIARDMLSTLSMKYFGKPLPGILASRALYTYQRMWIVYCVTLIDSTASIQLPRFILLPLLSNQQTQDAEQMLTLCWASIADGGLTLNYCWVNSWCLLDVSSWPVYWPFERDTPFQQSQDIDLMLG